MPKMRRVLVTLEVETVMPIARLKGSGLWNQRMFSEHDTPITVLQAQANVIRQSKGKKSLPKRDKDVRK
jgi:hypothetical protein